MKILLTNDDGIQAQGIHALIQELSNVGEIYLAAPDRERSGTGHSITVFEPIKVVKTKISGVKQSWIIGGTPVDCVKMALARLIDEKIDLVVSGINHGSNLGTDVLYSGTVSAAAEGVIMGSPSLAVSLNSQDNFEFGFAAQFTRRVVDMLTKQGFDKNTLININIPDLPENDIKGIRFTKLGLRNYDNLFEERRDPRGNTYYWLGGGVMDEEQDPESDVYAVDQGFISVTPIHLDLTDYQLINQYRRISPKALNRLLQK
ncbi:Survival protein SurE-like phosphatase/nucleotidase [Syntrophomonas zehnderi OL-4]|uniref:5'-nucleotidase SurE n=1 Tax=Syntrophomonas zehnderi OL-4 TaxID=690567 RepID=A0A0E3W2F2_9FIRM|nr:5'/3'-nucleotidase SurE [Syntrophomonas zehnderi]CFW97113.1 Survival protein SurE-like phosphatase/nucleotidase [Syntrophomonas zehnderi OL-4]